MLPTLRLLLTVLNRPGKSQEEKQPWDKGNSWLIPASISDILFDVKQVYYTNGYNGGENLSAGITDISFVVTQTGSNPL